MIRGEVNVQRCRLSINDEPERGVWIHCLRIDGKPLPVELFEMIPQDPLAGEPLGYVNLHDAGCARLGDHLHLFWVNAQGELRSLHCGRGAALGWPAPVVHRELISRNSSPTRCCRSRRPLTPLRLVPLLSRRRTRITMLGCWGVKAGHLDGVAVMTEETELQGKMAELQLLQERLRKWLHHADRRMRFYRLFSLQVLVLQFVLTMAIPFVAYTFRSSELLLPIVTILSSITAVLASYQMATNPQGRWMDYLRSRSNLHRILYDIDHLLRVGGKLASERFEDLRHSALKALEEESEFAFGADISDPDQFKVKQKSQ